MNTYRFQRQEDKGIVSRFCFDAALNFELSHAVDHQRNQRAYKLEIQVLKVPILSISFLPINVVDSCHILLLVECVDGLDVLHHLVPLRRHV